MKRSELNSAKKLKKALKTIITQKKLLKMQQGKIEKLISSSRENSPTPQNIYQGFPHYITDKSKTIGNEIFINQYRNPNARRWSKISISFFIGLLIISPSTLLYLYRCSLSPSKSTLYEHIYKNFDFKSENLINISQINKICKQYRFDNEIAESVEIFGVLAVDAISLTPHIKVGEDGAIYGLIHSINISKEKIDIVKFEIEKQEKLIAFLKNETINNAFVFQFQPLNPNYQCFVVHIQSSNTGKANYIQIDLLEKIATKLKFENFTVISYATDGDSGYKSLVNNTIMKWNDYKKRPIIHLEEIIYTNDPLHILKRARYRLLSHQLVLFKKNKNLLNLTNAKSLLNLPKIVFYDAMITKMKDDYPLKLFDITKFSLLYFTEQLDLAAYFLPFSLLITALDSPVITIDERVDFLEISAFYLQLYRKIIEKIPLNERGLQKSKNSKQCLMFDNNLIDDYLATIITIDSIINRYNGLLCLNRIGTNPLEHHFGLLRTRAKYRDDFDTIVIQQSKLQILEEIENSIVGNIVKARKQSFGKIIDLENIDYGEKSGYSNFNIAYLLMWKFGFPMKLLRYKLNLCDMHACLVIFEGKINKTIENTKVIRKKFIFNSNDHSFGSPCGAFIRKRQFEKDILPKDFESI